MNRLEIEETLQPSIRDSKGLIQVVPSNEKFFGQSLIGRTSAEQHLSVGATRSVSIPFFAFRVTHHQDSNCANKFLPLAKLRSRIVRITYCQSAAFRQYDGNVPSDGMESTKFLCNNVFWHARI